MKRVLILLIAILFTGLSNTIQGQDKITVDDYDRAVSFMYENYNNKKVFNLHIEPHWFKDHTGVWFIHRSPENKRYLKISLPDRVQSDLFDHQKLATVLGDLLQIEVNAKDLPLTNVEYIDPAHFILTAKDKRYTLNIENYELTPTTLDDSKDDEQSPDKRWTAFAKDYNLYLKSNENGAVRQLSKSGLKGYEYASWYGWGDIMEGEDGTRPDHFGVNWSEDSKWVSANIVDLRSAQKMHLLDWSIDSLYRPKLLSYYRGSPGDTTMIYTEPVFFNIASGKEIKIDLPKTTHINPTNIKWLGTSGKVLLEQKVRGYQEINLYVFDLNTERIEKIYSETSDTNIDNFSYRLSKNANELFILSEKSGWRQLYHLDLNTKKETPITKGDYFIHGIERIDEENEKIFFMASGENKNDNPYYENLYSISFNGENLKRLTPEKVHHNVDLSPDGKYVIDNYSTVNAPTTTVLRGAYSGEIYKEMGRADVSLLKNWVAPEIFTATARDNKTTIYGALWKPTNFDKNKSYPVIERSYTGPHTQVFPKSFTQALALQSYAELGFVMVVVDGLGSSGRSKEFHNYSYKNLGGNLEDHVIAIKELGKKYAWVDTEKVGIFGHSAGGYDAGHAVLAYPDFYKVAVASSADHDHRMEKAWWPEMYMGWPVDEAYEEQSNITMAGNLNGKLLLVHGGIDENVNPSATFKMAEALIKADKQFDMLILPSQRHGYRNPHLKYFIKTRWNYFVRHLRGVEPLWNFSWN